MAGIPRTCGCIAKWPASICWSIFLMQASYTSLSLRMSGMSQMPFPSCVKSVLDTCCPIMWGHFLMSGPFVRLWVLLRWSLVDKLWLTSHVPSSHASPSCMNIGKFYIRSWTFHNISITTTEDNCWGQILVHMFHAPSMLYEGSLDLACKMRPIAGQSGRPTSSHCHVHRLLSMPAATPEHIHAPSCIAAYMHHWHQWLQAELGHHLLKGIDLVVTGQG